MDCLPVADRAGPCNGISGPEMTFGTMPGAPIPGMAPRSRLIVAADAEVLPVAGQAALPVPLGHEPVAERSPGVRMVPGQTRVVTDDAVVLFMAHETGFAGPPRFVDVQVRRCSMKLDPVTAMRIGPGKGYLLRRWY